MAIIAIVEDKMETELQENEIKLTRQELIERYAEVQKLSIEEAEEQIGAPTEEEILKNIREKTIEKINSTRIPMNRAQRRALKKKVGAKRYAEMITETGDVAAAVSETAQKLNYVHLIEKLRKLNEEKEKNGETITENN
jgi:hypothetical protein